VVLAHMGLMDPRAYVRMAAILRQQIADGTLQPGANSLAHTPQPRVRTRTVYL